MFATLCSVISVTGVQLSCSRWKASRSNVCADEQEYILLGFWLPLQNTIALKVSMIRIYCHCSGVGTPWWSLDSSLYVVPSCGLFLPYSFWLIIPKGRYALVVTTKSQTEFLHVFWGRNKPLIDWLDSYKTLCWERNEFWLFGCSLQPYLQ